MAEASSTPEKTGPPRKEKKIRRDRAAQGKVASAAGAFLVFVLLRALMVTVRCRLREPLGIFGAQRPRPGDFLFLAQPARVLHQNL